jgi:flagellar biosynthetic protein FlhB
MAGSGEEKTEKPTAKRKREARREGQVARTPDLGGWLSVLVLGLAVGPLLGHEVGAWRELLEASLRASERPSVPLALHLLGDGARHAFLAVLVVAGMVLLVGVASAVGQGGLVASRRCSGRRRCGRAPRCCSRARWSVCSACSRSAR